MAKVAEASEVYWIFFFNHNSTFNVFTAGAVGGVFGEENFQTHRKSRLSSKVHHFVDFK
jgi:hypothetical protein